MANALSRGCPMLRVKGTKALYLEFLLQIRFNVAVIFLKLVGLRKSPLFLPTNVGARQRYPINSSISDDAVVGLRAVGPTWHQIRGIYLNTPTL